MNQFFLRLLRIFLLPSWLTSTADAHKTVETLLSFPTKRLRLLSLLFIRVEKLLDQALDAELVSRKKARLLK